LWEEGSTYFDYFYLGENCSYHVLAALEVADPSRDLIARLRNPVVPVDTVRALFAEKGLVRAVRYRPSLRSTVRHEIATLRGAELDALAAVLSNPDAPLPSGLSPAAAARVLDAASDVVDVGEPEALLKNDARVARQKQRLLERRAEIAVASDPAPVPVPYDKMPQAGHATSRLGIGTGYAPKLGGDFAELRYRLALHDLTDPPDGYPETSQLEFLPARLRVYPKDRRVELEELSILRIFSLSPWTRFERKLSWALDTGAARVRDAGCPDCLAALASMAAGATITLAGDDAHPDTLTLFALAEAGVEYAGRMSGAGTSDWRPGVGPRAGMRWRISRRLVWTAGGTWKWLPAASPDLTWVAETSARLALASDVAFGFDVRAQPLATEGVLSAFFYY
jgi:hypothetical protein